MIKIEIPQKSIERHKEKYSASITNILRCLSNKTNLGKIKQKQWSLKGVDKRRVAEYFSFLYNFQKDNDILTSPLEKLLELLRDENNTVQRIWGKHRPKIIQNILQKVFNYDEFCNNSEISLNEFSIASKSKSQESIKWGAFDFLKSLEIYVCPYCNADTIFATAVLKNNKNINIRSAFDHFFPKCQYPFLALSLYNLVPSCSRCNSNIKGTRTFSHEELINPYNDSFHDAMHFLCEFNNTEAFFGKTDFIKIKLLPRSNNSLAIKGQKTAKFFSMEEIYNAIFLPEVSHIMLKKYIFQNPTYKYYLKKILGDTTATNMNELLWGFSMSDKDINKFRLSKITIDLVKNDYRVFNFHI